MADHYEWKSCRDGDFQDYHNWIEGLSPSDSSSNANIVLPGCHFQYFVTLTESYTVPSLSIHSGATLRSSSPNVNLSVTKEIIFQVGRIESTIVLLPGSNVVFDSGISVLSSMLSASNHTNITLSAHSEVYILGNWNVTSTVTMSSYSNLTFSEGSSCQYLKTSPLLPDSLVEFKEDSFFDIDNINVPLNGGELLLPYVKGGENEEEVSVLMDDTFVDKDFTVENEVIEGNLVWFDGDLNVSNLIITENFVIQGSKTKLLNGNITV
ncbi:hypothetical protein P9112_013338 [Eukaryota sp. TZLM1-RC]